MDHAIPIQDGDCENCGQTSPSLNLLSADVFRKNRLGKDAGDIQVCQTCKDCFELRNTHLEEILNSDSPKRLIVAGPGTGKTHTFGEVLKSIPEGKHAVVFTLINNLVNDLRNDLGPTCHDGIRITTFHGLCRELLHSKVKPADLSSHFDYFPALPVLITSDSDLCGFGFSNNDFSQAFAHLDENEAMQFYLKRAGYYHAVSHSDAVYRVFKFYDEHGDSIPQYEIVIGDEYQDFNRLEASFISLLSQNNKVLLAGDDDQALYAFRGSSTEFIRGLHADDSFSKFSLPFCSRCPKVIVDATVHFVKEAQKIGFLKGRLDRDYQCYWPDKYDVSTEYQNIDLAKCSTFPTAIKFIQAKIEDLAKKEDIKGQLKGIPFLIIGPESGYHLDQVRDHLSENLDQELFEVIDGRPERKDLEIESGYFLLQKNSHSNLGWRIVLYCDPVPEAAEILKNSLDSTIPLEELLPESYKKKHLNSLAAINIEGTELKEADDEKEEDLAITKPKIRILLTNFFGSKGLSADHCFIVGLRNGVFPTNPKKVSNTDACKFLVALTRAKRTCCLVTSKEFDRTIGRATYKPSGFIALLPQDKVNKKEYGTKDGKLISL